MTPQQALEILDRVAAQTAMNRQDHMNVVQAVQTLQALIQEHNSLKIVPVPKPDK